MPLLSEFAIRILSLLSLLCHVYAMLNPLPQRERQEEKYRSSNSASGEPDILTLEVRPSLAGNSLHCYRFFVRCGTMKSRQYSLPESDKLKWNYPPATVPDKSQFEFPRGRCINFVVFINMTTRNQEQNLWNKQYQISISERNFVVEFHHYAKLAVSPNLDQKSAQSYFVQFGCTNTELDSDVLFSTHFKSETMVVLLDHPTCVRFTAKLFVLWPNQQQLGKPKMVVTNLGLRGQLNLKHSDSFIFSNHFLLEITPRLGSSRAYVVYVWRAGDKLAKRDKFVSTIREDLCTVSKCPLMVLINRKNMPNKEKPRTALYDIAVAEADEDWATNIDESDKMPEQIVFHKRYGVTIENGATFSWEQPRRRRSRAQPTPPKPIYYFFKKK